MTLLCELHVVQVVQPEGKIRTTETCHSPHLTLYLLSSSPIFPLPCVPPQPLSRELRCCSLERKVKEKDGTIDDLTQQVQSSALTYRTLQEGLVQVSNPS